MKKPFMVLPLVFLLCFTFGCQQSEELAEEPIVDVETDVQTIKAMLANNSTVINAGDLDGWLAQFTDDAIFMNPNTDTLIGVEASRNYATPLFENMDHEISISVDEVEVSGDWAFARWSFTWKFTPKAGGDTMQEMGKEIWIFKRQANNSWKCSHIIWNSDTPPQS